MDRIKDHYNLTYNDNFVGVYYVFDDHTYDYRVSSWESDIKDCKDLLAQMGQLKDIESKKPVASIEAMMKEEYRVAGRKRPIYKTGDFSLKRIPQETNDRFLMYSRDANKNELGYSDKDHSAPHYKGEKTPEGMKEWIIWYAFVKMDDGTYEAAVDES